MLNVRKIEQAMSDAKITKAQLYSRTKIARTTLDAVLNGSDAKISTIETIANALGVPVSYFLMTNRQAITPLPMVIVLWQLLIAM